MLKAGRYFNESRYFDSGRRAVEFGLNYLQQHGTIPALINARDADQTECSATYFYALEVLAVLELGIA